MALLWIFALILSYEFLSLTEARFSLKHKTEAVRWDATESGLSLKELPDAKFEEPSAGGKVTLTQAPQLRATGRRVVGGLKIRPRGLQACARGLMSSGPKLNTRPRDANTQQVAETLSRPITVPAEPAP